MNWLDQQPDTALKHWLSNTSIPMLATLIDGTILWCNEAFENLVEYTTAEIEAERISWLDLTVDKGDTAHDLVMAEKVLLGSRSHYEFQKKYATKTGRQVEVSIHVLRYPPIGEEFAAFLVSVNDLEKKSKWTMKKIDELHSIVTHMASHPPPTVWSVIVQWSKDNPKVAAVVTLFILSFLFGDRAIEIAQKIVGIVK